MMVLKKKTIIIITLVILIVAAGYLSTKYGKAIKVNEGDSNKQIEEVDKTDTPTVSGQVAVGYFIDEKLGRESQRSVSRQTLKDMIDDKNTSKEAKTKAETELLSIVKLSEKEMIIEALIKSKGFDDALVLLEETGANVTIKAKTIDSSQVNMVKDIVCRESGLQAVKVMVQARE